MSIGQVARRAGVKPSALRYYEGVGLLPPPERANGRRRYDGEVLRKVLDRLAVVRVAQQAGFTISEIRTLLDGFSEDTPPSVAGESSPKTSSRRQRRWWSVRWA